MPYTSYGCGSKRAFRSEAAAKHFIKRLPSRLGYVAPYRCQVCGRWHTTTTVTDMGDGGRNRKTAKARKRGRNA